MHHTEELPIISIALCTYNGEKYLEEQLDSLVNQTYPNIEIIAVDDCSHDSTLSILKAYSAKHKNLSIYTNTTNLGYSKNFEKSVSLCKGEYISISDQDDIWNLDKLSVLYEHIGDNLLIYAKSKIINSQGEQTGQSSMDKSVPYFGNDPRVNILINFIWGHFVMFKKELIPLTFPLPEKVSYDWFLGVVALNYGRIKYLDRALVHHRRHEESATSIFRKNRKKNDKPHMLRHLLRGIVTLDNLKYESFFREMYALFEKDSFFTKIRLFFFLIKYRNVLLYVSKKGMLSKLNYLRQVAFRQM